MSTTFNDIPALCEEILAKIQSLDSKVEHLLQTHSETEQKENNNNEDILLTIDQTVTFLGLAKSTLYSKVCRREIPHIKRGNRLYFSKKDLTEWLQDGQRPMMKDITHAAMQAMGVRMQ